MLESLLVTGLDTFRESEDTLHHLGVSYAECAVAESNIWGYCLYLDGVGGRVTVVWVEGRLYSCTMQSNLTLTAVPCPSFAFRW
jgi:hypothetical protein